MNRHVTCTSPSHAENARGRRALTGGMARWTKTEVTPGLAHGWHGFAWVWLHLAKAGIVVVTSRTIQAIARRLSAEKTEWNGPVSHLVGISARPVLATVLASVAPGHDALSKLVVEEWIARSRLPSGGDVMSGAAGALLAATEIAALSPVRLPAWFTSSLHTRCQDELSQRLGDARATLGLAHGIAGILLALEASAATFRHPNRRGLMSAALDLLEANRFSVTGGPVARAVWPSHAGDPALNAHGWCHGGPGIALSMLACSSMSGWDRYSQVADMAIEGIAATTSPHPSTCCGFIGSAQVLVEVYRLRRDGRYLRRARRLARHPAPARLRARERYRGLWKGAAGFQFLDYRLSHPLSLPFPGLGPLSIGEGGARISDRRPGSRIARRRHGSSRRQERPGGIHRAEGLLRRS